MNKDRLLVPLLTRIDNKWVKTQALSGYEPMVTLTDTGITYSITRANLVDYIVSALGDGEQLSGHTKLVGVYVPVEMFSAKLADTCEELRV